MTRGRNKTVMEIEVVAKTATTPRDLEVGEEAGAGTGAGTGAGARAGKGAGIGTGTGAEAETGATGTKAGVEAVEVEAGARAGVDDRQYRRCGVTTNLIPMKRRAAAAVPRQRKEKEIGSQTTGHRLRLR
jgi:hypothetical protein